MRQLGTLPDARQAQTLADYLLGLSIETRLLQAPAGCEVWVCDEDRLPQARAEFEAFLKAPHDRRYREAAPPRRQEPKEEPRPPRQPRAAEDHFPRRQLTLALVAASIVVTVFFNSREQKESLSRQLFITDLVIVGDKAYWRPEPPLAEVRHGEVWRLVTPIFIHFDVLHLLGNVLCLIWLGGQVEQRYGPLRLALLVLLVAVPSNLCQYFFSTVTLDGWALHVEGARPYFGGMSGVVFGLFGFVWMKALYEPGCGLFVTGSSVLLMMVWLLLCMTGVVGRVANTAHLVGLAVGMLSGYASAWWNGFGEGERGA